MSIRLGRTLADGFSRIVSRTGLVLFAGLLAIQFLTQISINTALLGVFPPEATSQLEGMVGLTLPVSGTAGALLFVLTTLLSSAFFVVISRALARPATELATLPRELYTRRVGRASVSMIGGGFIVGLSVSVGLVFFVLPGLFLGACFLFFIFAVGVEDRRAISALKRSWNLSRGHRIKLGVIVLLSGVIGGVVGAVGAVFELAASPAVSEIATNTISSALFVVLYGIMAEAYLQVRDGGVGPSGRSGTTTEGHHTVDQY